MITLNPKQIEQLRGYQEEAHRELSVQRGSKEALKDIIDVAAEALEEDKAIVRDFFKKTFDDKLNENTIKAQKLESLHQQVN